MSSYVEVSILDPGGKPRGEYKVKSKGGGRFVEAINGEQYGIRLRNKSATQTRGFLVYVDGHEIDRPALLPNGTYDITEVISKVFTAGGVAKKVYQPLTFAYPEIKEGGEDLSDGVVEELGCIEIQVFEAKETPPIPVKRPVLSLESLKVAMSEEQATMKGAFRSVTTLGPAERVETLDASQTTNLKLGEHLGDVKLRYGSRAMLLFKGVPAAEFMESFNNNNTAADDDDDEDDDDEQSEGDPEPRNGGRKRGRASGPVSRPPPEPVRRSHRMADKRLKSEH